MSFVKTCIAVFPLLVSSAFAYEYPLQFTPGSGARGLVVAGYQIVGATVTGTCSYYTVTSGSGKGGGYHSTTTYYNQTCTWDLSGNLLNVAQGAPVAPPPLYIIGTKTVYSASGGITAGSDSALLPNLGFVDAPGPHYTWGALLHLPVGHCKQLR